MPPSSNANYGTSVAERLHDPLSQWAEALAAFGRGLRVALPATVVSFNATAQTIVAAPAITEVARIAGVLTTKALPKLVDVPVVLPRAGGFTLTFPIQAGDECLIIFADSCIDAWWQAGGQQNQIVERRHALADGFAILGPWNQKRVLANYSTSSAQLRNDAGTVTVDVAASQVTVTAPTVQVNASSQASVTAPTVNVAGSTAVNITGGHCSIDGRNFLNHTHSGVASGGSSSGPVV
jgi:hypothetical protein